MNNEKNLKVKLTRGELVDLVLLCRYYDYDEDAKKWHGLQKLQMKLYEQLREYDEKHFDEEE